MKIALRRQGYSLVPVDEASAEAVASIENGRPVIAKVMQARNEKHHRLMWAMLRKVHDNLTHEDMMEYPTPQSLLSAVKVALGYYDMVRGADGRPCVVLRSTAFENMDQVEFRGFFAAAMGVLNSRFVRVENTVLKREIMGMVQ